jgi:hypothetical protein
LIYFLISINFKNNFYKNYYFRRIKMDPYYYPYPRKPLGPGQGPRGPPGVPGPIGKPYVNNPNVDKPKEGQNKK